MGKLRLKQLTQEDFKKQFTNVPQKEYKPLTHTMTIFDSNGYEQNEDTMVKVPILVFPASCGSAPTFEDNPATVELYKHEIQGIKLPLVIIAHGDSMSPLIESGDILLFDRQFEPFEIKERVVTVFYAGSMMIKKFDYNIPCTNVFLYSINPAYKPIVISRHEDFDVVGKYKRKITRKLYPQSEFE